MAPPPGSYLGSSRTSACSAPESSTWDTLGGRFLTSLRRGPPQGGSCSPLPRSAHPAQAEPPVRIASVGVEVVGDLPHDAIDRPLPRTEAGVSHPRQLGQHVAEVTIGGRSAVALPHDH